jgi:TolB-like protein
VLPAAVPDDSRIAIASLGLRTEGSASPDLATALSGVVSARLDELGVFTVVSSEDLRHLVDFDALQATLATEDTSRLEEIGKTLGVPYLVAGNVLREGGSTVIHLTLFDLTKARAIERAQLSTSVTTARLVNELKYRVDRVVQPLLESRRGLLHVSASEEGADVLVDEVVIGTTPLPPQKVAAGPHRVALRKEGFNAAARDVVVPPDADQSVSLVLIPSREHLDAYRANAWTFRIAAWSAMGAGLAAAGAAAGVYGVYLAREQAIAAQTKQADTTGPLQVRSAHFTELAAYVGVSVTLLAVSVPIVATGVGIYVLGDDPGRYDHLVGGE